MEIFRIRRKRDGLFYKGYDYVGSRWGPKGRQFSKQAISQIVSCWRERIDPSKDGIRSFNDIEIEHGLVEVIGMYPIDFMFPSKKKGSK